MPGVQKAPQGKYCERVAILFPGESSVKPMEEVRNRCYYTVRLNSALVYSVVKYEHLTWSDGVFYAKGSRFMFWQCQLYSQEK